MMLNKVKKNITNVSRSSKIKIVIASDLFIGILSSLIVAYSYSANLNFLFLSHGINLLAIVYFLYVSNIYSNQLKYLSNKAILEISYIFIFLIILNWININLFGWNLSSGAHLYSFLTIFFAGIVFSRFFAQSIVYKSAIKLKNILIYGAGVSGNKLYKSLSVNSPEYNVIGFIDDDPKKINEKIDSINIYPPEDIKLLKEQFECYAIFIALPSISADQKKSILINLIDEDIIIKIVPSIKSIVEKNSNFSDIQNIKIEDIIGRETVIPDENLLSKNIENKIVLITGGGGSIGSELVKQVMKLNPKKVVALDMSELNLFNLKSSIKNAPNNLDIVLGSITDKPFLKDIITKYKFDIVFHAAAYKHVNLVEDNVLTGVMNNIYGTFLLSDLCIKNNVDHFVLVSTDKAVRPSNYMGKSKLITEIIVNKMMYLEKISLRIVRFGNVLNSSGSVLSIFEKQIKNGGPLTVTDKDVTRFFMSIPEAAQLIIQSSSIDSDYNTFILEMGDPYNIYNLAKKMIQINGFKVKEGNGEGIEIQITSLQPGEKLNEELAIKEEDLKDTIHPKIYSTKEEYGEFNIFEWIQSLKKLYNKNDRKEFKALINSLISSHERLN